MLYSVDIEIPAGKAETAKKITDIKVTKGILHQVDVYFPAGHAGLTHVQIYDGAHQFVPSTEGQNLNGDDLLVTGREFYEIDSAPRIITVKTWNTDTVHKHTVTVRLWLLPRWTIMPYAATDGIIKALSSLFVRNR